MEDRFWIQEMPKVFGVGMFQVVPDYWKDSFVFRFTQPARSLRSSNGNL
jgi:hypothetical protein